MGGIIMTLSEFEATTFQDLSEKEKESVGEILEKTKELYDFVDEVSGEVYFDRDNLTLELSYKRGDIYMSFLYKPDKNKLNGYLAIGAWDKSKEFNYESDFDYIKELVSAVLAENKDKLMYEFSIERKG